MWWRVMACGVLLIDDSSVFRKTVKSLLASNFPSVPIEEAENAKEACGKIDECLPKLIFLDIRLPDKSGLLLTEEIKKVYPDVTIVILSGYDAPETQEVAFKKGASLFLSKVSAKASDIVAAAESVLSPKGGGLEEPFGKYAGS
jgi:DNA-binding NarL/FixJ family response regulator